jgi:uncharacterized membrane protein
MQETREATPPPADKETGRLEAFSDGVFAIAITLLILNIEVPKAGEGMPLAIKILEQWPAFLAYGVAFLTILIMWINHHALFKIIRHIDRAFLVLNGLLLMAVTFINYPTALMAHYLASPRNQSVPAAVIFSGSFVVVAFLFNVLWRYAAHNRRLLGAHVDDATITSITRRDLLGFALYVVALALSFVWVQGSLILNLLLALYFALAGRSNDTISA